MAKSSKESQTKDKEKSLQSALSQIETQFGPGTIMRMGDREVQNIPSISTGSLGLDVALGIGGLPKGRVVEIFGPESSGKTTLTLQIIAECQKAGGTAAFIDAEHALDPSYAEKIGVNVDDLLLSQPDTGEQALEVADIMVKSESVDVLVIDSVAALVPRAEIEGDMGDHHVGLQARLMSQALRKITGSIQKSNTLVIFINQIRMKIGVMFGNPETTTGGNALKFYSSVRLDIRRIGTVKDGDEVTKKEVKFNLSIDLLNAIADANWLNHYYEEHDTYITDMESRLGIESFAGWKADSFELENAKISFDGLKWRLSNEEGQEIILDDWSKDKPFFRWIRNPLQPFSV